MITIRRPVAALLLGGCLILLTALGTVRVGAQTATPVPATSGRASVSYDFKFIRQGQAGIIEIAGADITGALANTVARTYICYPTSTGAACLIAIPMDQAIKDYPITLAVRHKDGASTNWSSTISVATGNFLGETFTLPRNLMYLTNDDVQANEDDRLLNAYSIITQTRYWDGQFTPPVNSGLSSPFGTVRSYTGSTAVRRHTGQDLRATIGTPVLASANGRVVLARLMDIHGNNVVIDHGWGIYSEYAHMSEMFVVPGQYVLQGDVIGLSGNTGRSTGPHVHWEIAVDDIWVNPLEFAKLKLPQ